METGKKIRKIATLFFVVTSIVFIGCGILLAAVVYDMVPNAADTIAAIGTFVGVTGIGLLIGWIGRTLLTGFGELVENSAVIRENTAQKETPETSTKNPEPPASVTKTRQSETTKQDEAKGVCPIPAGHNRIRCPECNTEQPMNSKKCSKCGQTFIHE